MFLIFPRTSPSQISKLFQVPDANFKTFSESVVQISARTTRKFRNFCKSVMAYDTSSFPHLTSCVDSLVCCCLRLVGWGGSLFITGRGVSGLLAVGRVVQQPRNKHIGKTSAHEAGSHCLGLVDKSLVVGGRRACLLAVAESGDGQSRRHTHSLREGNTRPANLSA